MKTIFERRSIRKYQDQPVPYDLVEKLLMAAMQAPSSENEQPWHFIVIDDKALLTQIADFDPYAQMLRSAPAAVAVCGDLTLERSEGYWIQDCSAATENMLLEAVHLGLGAVWLGIYPEKELISNVQKIFDLPEHVLPLSIVSIGYPTENLPPKNRFKQDRIHLNRW